MSSAAPSGQPQEITSLDQYRYRGQSLKEWESGYMRQQDYTQKTQQVAQERRYYDNLNVDLEQVKRNPALAEQFKSVYPEKFHAYLRYVLENSAPATQTQAQPSQPQYAQVDPKFMAEFTQMRDSFRAKEVAAITAELDSKFAKLSQTYPYADEEAVVARGQALLAEMKKRDPLNPNLTISDKQWDVLWKTQNERAEKLAERRYQKKVQEQLNASKKGADVGPGGGLPGQAPRKARTIKEAGEMARADIESGLV